MPLNPGSDAQFVESEEDLDTLSREALREAVVFGTDWTAETVVRQLHKKTISLDPLFQRRDAWDAVRKSRFIESLFLGIPIPQLVFAEDKTQKGSFIVIDGKQRLLTLFHFAGLDTKTDPLRLRGLRVLKELEGKTYQEIKATSNLLSYASWFENQPIRTVIVRNWLTEDILYLIFHRLNTGSVSLSPQELRQAMHPGPFLTFCFKYSAKSAGLRKLLKLNKPDFRMRDVELLIRFFAFEYFLKSYTGNLKLFLDATCKKLNKDWPKRETEIRDKAVDFESAVEATYQIFGIHAFRKFSNLAYERTLNRAVCDIMLYFFSDEEVRNAALKDAEKVRTAFEDLCSKNRRFLRSLETTTKSKEATSTRLNLWAKRLARVTGIPLLPPISK